MSIGRFLGLALLIVTVFIAPANALAGPAQIGPPDPQGPRQHFRGTIAALDASSLTLTLQDGSSQVFVLTSATRIKIPGAKHTGATLQVGMKAMVLAVGDPGGELTAWMVHVIPGKPVRAHRVGTVTAYSPGSSITIQASDGNAYTFPLTAETKILPAERAGELGIGSRVTIIAPRVPSSLDLIATGIVVHPAP